MLVQVRDNKKTLINIQNYNKFQAGQKWDENGTPLGTPNGTSKEVAIDTDITEIQETSKEERDMSVDTSKDNKRTAEGHKQ